MNFEKVEMDYTGQEEREKSALERGCSVVTPRPNELFLDIDTDEDLETFKGQISLLELYFEGDDIAWRAAQSPSGRPGRYHVTVTVPRFVDEQERVALQACLGSDRKRELLSLKRIRQGHISPTCFFEKLAAA